VSALYQNFLRRNRGELPPLPAYSDFGFFADEVRQYIESAAQSLAIKCRIGWRDGQNQCSVFERQRRLINDAGHANGQHVRGPQRCSDDPSPPLNPLADEAAKPL
jgi:hypothetical protein